MKSPTILIVSATQYGSTREVAEAIAATETPYGRGRAEIMKRSHC